MIEKSANRMWKESGTTLSFKDWLIREKEKFINFNGNADSSLIINKPLNDSIENTLIAAREGVGIKNEVKGDTTFGIKNYLLIGAGVLVVGLIAYKVIKSRK